MEFLIENREKQKEQASCYRLPLRALSKEFKVAGDEVGDLLRSQSEPCLMDPDAKSHYPWIGFLAAGIGSHSQPVNWIAFVTSDSQSALTLMKNKGSKLASRPETADTERAKVLRKVIEALLAYFTQGTKLAPDKAGLDDPIDLAKIRDECTGLAVAEHSDADNCSALAEILVMYEDAFTLP